MLKVPGAKVRVVATKTVAIKAIVYVFMIRLWSGLWLGPFILKGAMGALVWT